MVNCDTSTHTHTHTERVVRAVCSSTSRHQPIVFHSFIQSTQLSCTNGVNFKRAGKSEATAANLNSDPTSSKVCELHIVISTCRASAPSLLAPFTRLCVVVIVIFLFSYAITTRWWCLFVRNRQCRVCRKRNLSILDAHANANTWDEWDGPWARHSSRAHTSSGRTQSRMRKITHIHSDTESIAATFSRWCAIIPCSTTL